MSLRYRAKTSVPSTLTQRQTRPCRKLLTLQVNHACLVLPLLTECVNTELPHLSCLKFLGRDQVQIWSTQHLPLPRPHQACPHPQGLRLSNPCASDCSSQHADSAPLSEPYSCVTEQGAPPRHSPAGQIPRPSFTISCPTVFPDTIYHFAAHSLLTHLCN